MAQPMTAQNIDMFLDIARKHVCSMSFWQHGLISSNAGTCQTHTLPLQEISFNRDWEESIIQDRPIYQANG